MKIYEKILYNDGGPNDRGTVIGYESVLEGEQPPTSKDCFVSFREISLKTYNERKKEAFGQYRMFKF